MLPATFLLPNIIRIASLNSGLRTYMKFLISFVFIISTLTFAYGQADPSPIVEKEIRYKDWTYKNLNGGGETNLRQMPPPLSSAPGEALANARPRFAPRPACVYAPRLAAT